MLINHPTKTIHQHDDFRNIMIITIVKVGNNYQKAQFTLPFFFFDWVTVVNAKSRFHTTCKASWNNKQYKNILLDSETFFL